MRLKRLERNAPAGDIPVWCNTPEQVPATIEAMIAEGEIRPEDRCRCVFWEGATFQLGAHEDALEALAGSVQ